MNRISSLILVLFVIICFNSVGNAGYKEDRDYYLGEIKSINKVEDKITIFDYIDGRERTFIVENGVGQDLKPGIEVMVSTLKGTSNAKKVKIIIQRSLNI